MKDILFQNVKLDDLDDLARSIIEAFPDEKVFAFYGEMGAGKTTMIKALCKFLGVTDDVTSPSFAIVNEYIAGGVELIYHFDFYRIKKSGEVFDIGYEEYLYSGYYCFLEWADKIEELLPETYVYINISKQGKEPGRTVKATLISD